MAISKLLRFEVFKRDKFTCQYCGRSAPDVILELDHIHPRSDGGEDTLLNLVTSCRDCNAGKSDRLLSDDTVVKRQIGQLQDLQDRRDQLEMIVQWRNEVATMDASMVDEACRFFVQLQQCERYFEPVGPGKQKIAKWLREFGPAEVLEAMQIAAEQYFLYDSVGNVTEESYDKAFAMVSGICRNRRLQAEKPWLKDVNYVVAVVRNRFTTFRPHVARSLVTLGFESGYDRDGLKEIAVRCSSWSRWVAVMESLLYEEDDDG